jgi:hypothetical protein
MVSALLRLPSGHMRTWGAVVVNRQRFLVLLVAAHAHMCALCFVCCCDTCGVSVAMYGGFSVGRNLTFNVAVALHHSAVGCTQCRHAQCSACISYHMHVRH